MIQTYEFLRHAFAGTSKGLCADTDGYDRMAELVDEAKAHYDTKIARWQQWFGPNGSYHNQFMQIARDCDWPVDSDTAVAELLHWEGLIQQTLRQRASRQRKAKTA